MAGWSMIAVDDKTLEADGFWVDISPVQNCSGQRLELDVKLRYCFDGFLKSFLKEVCSVDGGFLPLQPMVGNGQNVDLLRLFLVVKGRGGYDVVSKNSLWDLVAQESGLGFKFGPSLKLVYVKYLDALERWLKKLGDDKSLVKCGSSDGDWMDLGSQFSGCLLELHESRCLEESKCELNMSAEVELDDGELMHIDSMKSVVDSMDSKCLEESKCELNMSSEVELDDGELMCIDSMKSVVDSMDSKCLEEPKCKLSESVAESTEVRVMDCLFDDGDEKHKDVDENSLSGIIKGMKSCNEDGVKSVIVEVDGVTQCDDVNDDSEGFDSNSVRELSICHKRKRESMSRMLNWVTGVAMNPGDPGVDPLPDCWNWKSYGNEELWKQVLLAREALSLKRYVAANAEQPVWQKNQRMHPSMYDDHAGSSYNLRERSRCCKKSLSGKTSRQSQAASQPDSTQAEVDSCLEGNCDGNSSTEYSVLDLPIEMKVPLGPHFQVEVPEWTGIIKESDSKWAGTRIWPLGRKSQRSVIEREPIGKGRQDSCGCLVPKSVECVRFHSSLKKSRLKCELGVAFYQWRFHKMGEDAKVAWVEEEEKKFKAIVTSNPPSHGVCFWDELCKSFPKKRREDLVSYYFNVFLLQRRAYQNRFTPDNICSDDDDESEYGLETVSSANDLTKSPGSLLSSAKKRPKRVG